MEKEKGSITVKSRSWSFWKVQGVGIKEASKMGEYIHDGV